MTKGLSREERRALERRMKKERKQKKQMLKEANVLAEYSASGQGWIPKGEILEFAGRSIPGMVYFGIPEKYYSKNHNRDLESSVYIDPRKNVAELGDRKFDKGLNAYSYGRMTKECRANYLDWLANGKSDRDCSIAYPILYFYGLERRYFLDDPDEQEKQEICEEINRLNQIYGDNELFESETADFTTKVLELEGGEDSFIPESELGNLKFYHEAIETFFQNTPERTFDVEDCLQFARSAMKHGLLDPTPYVNEKWFELLFPIRFEKVYPNGFPQKKPDVPIHMDYESASGEFEKQFPVMYEGKTVYETPELEKLLKTIEIFCMNLNLELADHFYHVKNHPNHADSFEALKHLPIELWGEFQQHGIRLEDHFSELTSWARQKLESGLTTPVSAFDLNSGGGIWTGKLNRIKCADLREPMVLCGFGAAPDFCLRFRKEKPDDPAVIYELDSREKRIAPDSESYQSALTEISVGAYVLQTEKRSVEESRNILTGMISKRTDLTENERRGLTANLKCVLEIPHDRNYLRRLQDGIKTDWINGVTRFLVDLAHVDGMVQKQTVSVIEKVYDKLGLDPARAYSDLHAGTGASDSNRKTGTGSNVSELDESRIESIRTDTEEVSKVLGGIFTDEDNAKDVPVEDGQIVFKGLDIKHATFLQKLLEREHWTLDEFEELARNHGLLPVGAVETINEWMFEKFEEPLLDEQDGYHVAQNIAGNLISEFEARH